MPRPRVHLALLALTFVSLALSGGLIWEGGIAELQSDLDLLRPRILWSNFVGGLTYAFWVLAILGAHEMGHYVACRYYGIPATLPFFIPGIPPLGSFGAVIRIRGRIPHRKALFDVAAAGPIAGFLVTLPALILGLLTVEPVEPIPGAEGGLYLGQPVAVALILPVFLGGAEHFHVNSLFVAGWVGMLVTSLNLFPVGQLDGGHAAYAFSRRVHRFLSRATLLALMVFIVLQLLDGQFPAYIVWFAILLVMRDRHPRLLEESTSLGAGRRLLAILLLLLFVLCFIAVPFSFIDA
jgi:membrane-associated protease RseP (regulator of RpoE activity)